MIRAARRIALFIALAVAAAAGAAAGQGKSFTLAADPALGESGALAYVLPRFSLKTSVRIELVDGATDGAADATLGTAAEGPPVFAAADGGAVYRLALRDGAVPHAERFRDWLTSETGLRTIESFEADGAQVFARVAPEEDKKTAAAPTGDAALGERLAVRRCGRCHVVNDKNRFAGIGSTPSFGAMKNLPRWRERFEAFWTQNPHPSFTQIEGVTEPFSETNPPHIAPLLLTIDEVDAIVAYVVALERKDLGGALIEQ